MLKETNAPDGYILLGDEFYFQIKLDGTVQITDAEGTVINDFSNMKISLNNKTISVKNVPGTPLPFTGGTGTTIFYLIGGFLVVTSGLMLLRKKRTN